jgi:hypothetical protein
MRVLATGRPNTTLEVDKDGDIQIVPNRLIGPGEELTTSYERDPWNPSYWALDAQTASAYGVAEPYTPPDVGKLLPEFFPTALTF